MEREMGRHAGNDVNEPEARPFRSHESELVGIYEISKLLASTNRIEKSLASVLTLLSSFLDMRDGLITLLNEQFEPAVVIGPGWSDEIEGRFYEHPALPAVHQIVETRVPLVIENVLDSPAFRGADLSEWGRCDGATISILGVPINDRNTLVGVLTVVRIFDAKPYAPFDRDLRFLAMIANLMGQALFLHKIVARDRERLMREAANPARDSQPVAVESQYRALPGIIGESPAIRAVVEKIRIVARAKSTVMLRGETGTGKEMFAAAIHNLSPRQSKPFIKLNCAALSESVLESELFGHERGAFTGALNLHKGRFELADGGTLFLDEIGEITPAFQAKLLRVLQEGEFERVGGTRTIKVDVRLICATHRDLEAEVQKGKFRADLYYRISVVPILLPPLRERKKDIELLANKFLEKFNKEQGAHLTFSKAAIAFLSECSFPGNIRELENYVLRTATLAPGDVISDKDISCLNDTSLSSIPSRGSGSESAHFTPLPIAPEKTGSAPSSGRITEAEPAPPALCPGAENCTIVEIDKRSDREKIVDAMERAGWVKAKAARLLGLTPRQIGYALQKYNVPVKRI
jgi:Nif-specific regulatory protein